MTSESDQSAENMDPPAYTLTTSAPPTTLRRTVEDTRALIFANAMLIRSTETQKLGLPIELVLGKTRPSKSRSSSTARSFVSTTSNYTIRVTDTAEPAAGSSSLAAAERNQSDTNNARQSGKHYAALICRSGSHGHVITPILVGEPQESVEEALEWLLDQTETRVTDKLSWAGVIM